MRALPRSRSTLKKIALSLLATLTLLTAIPVFADDSSGAAGIMAAGAVFMVMLVVFAVFYIYFALAFQTIAKKTNTENAWWAWVPILNMLLVLNIAKKPLWWFILLLIPLVSIVIAIIVMMAVAEARNKPSWWGILMIVPGVNLIVPGYLAWSD